MRRHSIVGIAAVAVAVLAASSASAAVDPRTITVNGTGVITSVPDQADFSFGVSTHGATATAALSANAKQMTKVIAVLKGLGIAPRNIQTAQVSITPNTNQSGSKVLDYTATNSVTARTRNVATAGKVIDAVVHAGANLAGGPSLGPSDRHALSREALRAAIADAWARARVIAAAAHVKLGRVRSVTEAGSSPVTSSPFQESKAAATPIEAGTVQTEVDVTVTFDIL